VKSFVDAEKAMLDTIIKPNGAKSAPKVAHATKRPASRRRAPAAQAAGA
jgi:hypothetical protein